MKNIEVDVAVIGAGSAGLTARRSAAKRGAKVALVEGGAYGTTCARVGCMPSKLLIAAAELSHDIDRAPAFGIKLGEKVIDGKSVLARVRAERDRFVGFVHKAVDTLPEAQRIRGKARFTGPTTLVVEPSHGEALQLDARTVVIATGSTPWYPDVLRGAGSRLLTNDEVFELEALPRSLAVVGTGVIGLELGQAMARLGVRTAFFSIDDLLGPISDPVVRAKTYEVFGDELDLRLSVTITEVLEQDNGVLVRWKDPSGLSHEEHFANLLAATGRLPRVDGLGLEKTGLECDARGVPIHNDATMQCGNSPVFIAGDVTNQRPLLHEAADEGRIAGGNAVRFPDVGRFERRAPLQIVFSSPQIAVVGTPFGTLEESGVPFEVGEASFDDQGRARVMGVNQGHVRIYGSCETGCILGAEMFGPRMENMSHLLAWVVQAGVTVPEVLRMPFYHPVLEEGLRGALRDLTRRLKMSCPLDSFVDRL